jgi:hypothetical protein
MKAHLLGAFLAGTSILVGPAAGAPTAAAKPAPAERDITVKVVTIGEESWVKAATVEFGNEWNRQWESWITAADLPPAYRSKAFSNDSFVVLAADKTGKPTGCRPLRASAEPGLDALACRLLVERARFQPRYQGPGQPIAAGWVVAVRWRTVTPVTTSPAVTGPVPAPPGPAMDDYEGWPRLGWHDWFLFDDLPDAQAAYAAPARGPKGGRVSLDLIADPEAGIIGCEIGIGSGSAQLDEAACALARSIRLRYRNPCDYCFRDRVPIQVVWDPKGSRIRLPLASRWRFPRPDPPVPTYIADRERLPAQFTSADFRGITDQRVSRPSLAAELTVNAEGRPTACRIARSSGDAAVDRRACALFLKRMRYTLRTDVFGDPVADTVPVSLDLAVQP